MPVRDRVAATCRDAWQRLRFDAHANVAVIFALSLLPISVAVGGGIDYARAYNVRESLQNAIDAAVLAGAAADDPAATALSVFAAQIEGVEGKITTPTFSTDDDGHFTGTVNASVMTYFLPLVGIANFPIAATATAAEATAANSVCVLLTNTSSGGALTLNSGAKLSASDCEVDVKSAAYNAAVFNSGTTFDTAKTCIASNTVLENGGTHPNLEKGCTTVSDSFAGKLPTPSSGNCDYTWLSVNGGTATLYPGVYCGINFNNSPKVTFSPGLYVIKNGNWGMNGGSYSGTGVTFYFADTSQMVFNSTITVDFTAPTSGTYSGILIYEASGLSQNWWNFNTGSYKFSGLIYTPSRVVTFNSGASGTGNGLTWVASAMTMNSANWSITPGDKAISGADSAGSGAAYLLR